MTVTLATVSYYNARRYSTPWACIVTDGKNDFVRGAYSGNDDGGTITIDDPEPGMIYGFGQRDNRGGCSATYYVMWDGKKFAYCDRQGNPVDADYYAAMQHDNWSIGPCLEVQADETPKENETAEENETKETEKKMELTGIEEAVKRYIHIH